MKVNTTKKLSVLLLLSIALPSCQSFKKDEKTVDASASCAQHNGEMVLIEVNGKPALTEKEFEEFVRQAGESDQQLKFMIEFMPEGIREQLLKAKKRGIVIGEWAKSQGIRDTQEYKKKEEQYIKQIHEALDNEQFLAQHKAETEVSDAEARKFYDEQKGKDQRLSVSPAGVKAVGVQFDSKEAAQAFTTKLVNKEKDIEKVAVAHKLQAKNFGVVHQDSMIDAPVKKAVLAVKKFPTVEVVNDGKKFWVVASLSKEQATYHAFDDVKEGIKRLLQPKKLEDLFERELPQIEQKMNVKECSAYLEGLQQKRQKRELEMQQQQQVQQNKEAKETATAA